MLYPDIYDGPARSYRKASGQPVTSRKKYVTIHNTSNDASAWDEAAYAKTRTDGTSSHYFGDHADVVQSLDTLWCAGHVGSDEGNTYGISWEITGVNGWTRVQWLANVAWDKIAAQMAADCREFGIPVRLLTIAEMRAGDEKGFITHDMARIAWGGTDHTDPGPGFPMDHLLALVQAYLDGKPPRRIMRTIVRSKTDPKLYLADGLFRRHLETQLDVDDAIYLAETGQTPPIFKGGEIQFVDNLDAYGTDIATLGSTAKVDVEALAGELGPVLAEAIASREAAADRARADVLDGE